MFVDVHCHLDLLKDVSGAVGRAIDKNVAVLAAGVDFDTNRKVLEYVEKYDIVKGVLGVYPIDALKMSDLGLAEEIEFIRRNSGKIVGVGEVGIDLKENDEKEKQSVNFLKFIALAKELDKPLIVHSRKAEEECIELLEEMKAKKVIMHCFCGKKKFLSRIVENGWMLSVPGVVRFSQQFRDLVEEVPIESLLCETDAPFLHSIRGQGNNEPGNVIASYEEIGKIKGLKLEEVERKIEENYKQMFL